MYEYFQTLLEKYNVTAYRVAQETGVTTATLTNWKNGKYTPKPDKLQKIADYFGVPLSYLLTGKSEEVVKESELTERDKRDIGKDLDRIMDEIINAEDGPLFYNGKPISDKHLSLLRNAMEIALEDAKKKNKVTYNPNKNKKLED